MVAGRHQLANFHHLRLEFRETADEARLAIIRRIFRLHRCAVYRDVRFPSDHLSDFGLVGEAVSRCRSFLSRRGPFVEYAVWMENQSSLRSAAYLEQYFDLRWIHSSVRCMEGAV